ncbi:MAG: hypothetical protein JWM86_266, partial [Thermoleophilia bacterium]|nr:hypothetical protein [Thermoleophilia bacterium]
MRIDDGAGAPKPAAKPTPAPAPDQSPASTPVRADAPTSRADAQGKQGAGAIGARPVKPARPADGPSGALPVTVRGDRANGADPATPKPAELRRGQDGLDARARDARERVKPGGIDPAYDREQAEIR